MNYKIYHNPRCSKSRAGLAILSSFTQDFEIIDYLKEPPTIQKIEELLSKLRIAPIDLVRTHEAIWKENYKGKHLTDEEIIIALATHPKLIERPIIIKDDVAIIGRPTDIIGDFIQ